MKYSCSCRTITSSCRNVLLENGPIHFSLIGFHNSRCCSAILILHDHWDIIFFVGHSFSLFLQAFSCRPFCCDYPPTSFQDLLFFWPWDFGQGLGLGPSMQVTIIFPFCKQNSQVEVFLTRFCRDCSLALGFWVAFSVWNESDFIFKMCRWQQTEGVVNKRKEPDRISVVLRCVNRINVGILY